MKRIWHTLFRRSRVNAEISEEIQSHLAMRADLERQTGLSATEAESSARKKFGNATLVLEDTRRFHFAPFLESILQDLTHALRQLRRNPVFSLTVLFILALGIGASTAVFSVVDGVLFRLAPYKDPGRIVAYGITAPIERREFLFGFDYLYWRGRIPAFEAVTSMYPGDQPCDLTESNPPASFALVSSPRFCHCSESIPCSAAISHARKIARRHRRLLCSPTISGRLATQGKRTYSAAASLSITPPPPSLVCFQKIS
jgi:hypothetical protein